jgi:hypothetical protein
MTGIATFEVRKDGLSAHRVVERNLDLADGQVLAKVDRFALTANNVTYAVVGDRIGYWTFFPGSEDGWGVVPVWGIAEIVESRCPDAPVGERLYGYWPMASHLVMQPSSISEHQMFDGSAHRAELPPTYNRYVRLNAEADHDSTLDDARMVLWPLYATSFCLHDFLGDSDWFSAEQVIIPSASSKTAIGLAYALAADNASPASVGVTSPGNLEMVRALGLYDQIITYDEIEADLTNRPSVIVDMSGNGAVLGRLHKLLGENMRYTSNVGLTHYSDNQMGEDFIRDRSAMFFAPGHIQKRAKDWGKGEFERRSAAFWRDAALRSRSWLSMTRNAGPDAVAELWEEALSGRTPPDQGRVVGF